MKTQTAPTKPITPSPGPSAFHPKWAWHYRVLSKLRDQLERERLVRQAEITAPIDSHGADAADSAVDEFDHDLALTLLAREEDALTQVTEALERILKGSYGICLATGVQIPARRLRALPWCRYSREVEEAIEKKL